MPPPMSQKLRRGWVHCDCGSPHPGWWSHGLGMMNVQKHIALPRGWRWLRLGELPKRGDVLVDPRVRPVVIKVAGITREWRLTESHHPVRRRVASRHSGNP